MKSLDLQVIQQARSWSQEGRPIWLCTVLSTFGSAPRAPGAMLVAQSSGQWRGSLSGGCVEEDFLERLAVGFFPEYNQVISYGNGGLAPKLTLPCGGVIRVLVEYIRPSVEAEHYLGAIEKACVGAKMIVRELILGGQQRSCREINEVGPLVNETADGVTIRVAAVYRLILAGISPVAEFCAAIAVSMGYEVILCEPRTELLDGLTLPGVTVCPVFPATFISSGGCHAATAVVALTHDPRMDDLTLMDALRTAAFYIGAMGSERTSRNRLERLARIGKLNGEALERIHAPIGLRLGSKTPAEIAVAIMADILRKANGVQRNDL
ncbi:XdhC family protein [Pseudomonas fluorescens]